MSEENDKSKEANFNDAELQDIMAEIESLESDFAQDAAVEATSEPAPEPVAEVAEPVAEEVAEEIHEPEPVVHMDSPEPEPIHEEPAAPVQESNVSHMPERKSSDAQQVSFSGEGQLNFAMNFPLGDGEAHLHVEETYASIQYGDIEFTLSEEGIVAKMPGGAMFSWPLQHSHKKAA